jgi:CRP/FNR family transcriptional regulator
MAERLAEARTDLDAIAVLAGLDAAARRFLEKRLSPRACADGEIIVVEGSASPPVLFVLEGTLRASRTGADGRQQVLGLVGPGEACFLPAAFAHDRSAPATAEAVGPVRLLSIAQEDFRRAVEETPGLAAAVLEELSDRVRKLVDLAHDLSLVSVRGRLARFLLDQVEKGGSESIRWTHDRIAAQIGTAREVVSRTLRGFVRDGLVRMRRQRIEIVDAVGLERATER